MGIDNPSDECLNEFLAGSNVVGVIFFLFHNMMETMVEIVFDRLQNKTDCILWISRFDGLLCPWHNRTFTKPAGFIPV